MAASLLSAKLLSGLGIVVLLKRYFNGAVCHNHPNLTGKYIIITGANAGIGKVTAIELAKLGAYVIIACRDPQRAEDALQDIKKESKSSMIEFLQLDLSDLSSIRKFSEEYHKKFKQLDILLNNAGIMGCPYTKTKDSFEMQIGTNHLGHFLLTNLLLYLLKKTPNSRVVTVASGLERDGTIDLEDLHWERRPYDPFKSYCQSKSANISFAEELYRRYGNAGISSVSLHPGVIVTELSKHYINHPVKKMLFYFLSPILHLVTKNIWYGTQTSLYCCVTPDLRHGHFSDCAPKKPKGRDSCDPEVAQKLWDLSAKLVGL